MHIVTAQPGLSHTAFRRGVVLVLLLAAAWRVGTAANLPSIARDGVTFCWYAQGLQQEGWAFLRAPEAVQHPLYPVLLLGTFRLATLLGVPDSPWTWQYCGQLVALLAGLAVVVLSGALTLRLVRRLELPVDARLAALFALLAATLLDHHIALAADVMSDQLHLAFFLAAAWGLLGLHQHHAALLVGLCSGLAFLTRQEGVIPALAGLGALVLALRTQPAVRVGTRAAALLLGFSLLAVPFWATVGQFSPKKSIEDVLGAAGGAHTSTLFDEHGGVGLELARLETRVVPWYLLAPWVFYETLRGGRVLLPLLALPPLWNLRRLWLRGPLAGLTLCIAGHFLVLMLLLERFGYLAPRHSLPIVVLLTPFAALLLARIYSLLAELRQAWIGVGLCALLYLPLALYGLRTPNYADRMYPHIARDLCAIDATVAGRRMISGSGAKRVAFYTQAAWEPWYEDPDDVDNLIWQLRQGRPGYLLIETGDGGERRANAELLQRLRRRPEMHGILGQEIQWTFTPRSGERAVLHAIPFDPAGISPRSTPAEE